MNPNFPSAAETFKGIALFTPGGDFIYCIDPSKQGRWHLHLCAVLQEILDLSEPPHFLVPCYTATLDRTIGPASQQLEVFAEAHPLVFRYRALLSAVFETAEAQWHLATPPAEICNPVVLETYRQRFPQLWESHDLVVRWETTPSSAFSPLNFSAVAPIPEPQGYVLRLFVSGYSATTQRILQGLHELLETSLTEPYTLKVIDIFKHPEQAEIDQVSATPTLVKVYPRPIRRIVGDLEDIDRILRMLSTREIIDPP